jgi:hypothetical protein
MTSSKAVLSAQTGVSFNTYRPNTCRRPQHRYPDDQQQGGAFRPDRGVVQDVSPEHLPDDRGDDAEQARDSQLHAQPAEQGVDGRKYWDSRLPRRRRRAGHAFKLAVGTAGSDTYCIWGHRIGDHYF